MAPANVHVHTLTALKVCFQGSPSFQFAGQPQSFEVDFNIHLSHLKCGLTSFFFTIYTSILLIPLCHITHQEAARYNHNLTAGHGEAAPLPIAQGQKGKHQGFPSFSPESTSPNFTLTPLHSFPLQKALLRSWLRRTAPPLSHHRLPRKTCRPYEF